MAVLGSAALFEDAWLDKEENAKLMDTVFRWLLPVSKPDALFRFYSKGTQNFLVRQNCIINAAHSTSNLRKIVVVCASGNRPFVLKYLE